MRPCSFLKVPKHEISGRGFFRPSTISGSVTSVVFSVRDFRSLHAYSNYTYARGIRNCSNQ